MNSAKKQQVIKILKITIAVLFVIGALFIAFYPVRNQDVTVLVDNRISDVSVTLTADEISTLTDFFIELPNVTFEDIKEIRIYRFFKSVCIDKITTGTFYGYAQITESGIIFNQEACDLLAKQSKTFLMERLMGIEVLFTVAIALWIVVNALGEKFDPDNRNNHGPIHEIKRFFSDMKQYGQYMIYAANADLKAEVANSYLNRLWWLLEPFFNMLVYVLVFGRLMGRSVDNYATFIFSAILMWTFFSKTINYSVKCVRFNRDIVSKVYVPKHVLLISNMFLNFFKLLFSLIVLIPMLIIFHVHVGIGVLWIIPAYVLMILLSFGTGMICLHYGVYIDDLSYAVGILLQMLMFLSGIFYDVITGLSLPLNVMMLSVNPVSMFIDTMRNALLYNVVANVPLIILWTILSLLICYIGVHIVYKNENGYVKVV